MTTVIFYGASMLVSNRNAGLRRFLFPVVAGSVLVAGAVTAASSADPEYVVVHNCNEQQAFVDGDSAAVAARLPQRYTAVRDPVSKAPLLFFRAEHCLVTLGSSSFPATMASFGIVVKSPDGRGCASGVPIIGPIKGDVPPLCNWYTLRWLATSQAVTNWLKAGTPEFPAVYSPDLAFTVGAVDPSKGGAPFSFRAPGSTQTPFEMRAITRPRPGKISVRGGYWTDTTQGTVKLAFTSNTLRSGDARGTVSAPEGTEVASLLGATTRGYLPGYSAFSAEFFDKGIYRKQVYGSTSANSFAGSCSVQGTVTFTPPATNTPQHLHYDYAATGTCNGDTAVRLHQAGDSQGSCSQAWTTQPGHGSLTFDSGVSIDYTLDFTSFATEVSFTLYGARSGTAPARATFATPRMSPGVLLQCDGAGAGHVPMDMTLKTQTPLVG